MVSTSDPQSMERRAGRGRRRVLCVAGWWPGANDVAGVFIKEHVQAIAMKNEVEVIHLVVEKCPAWMPSIRTVTALEDGVRVHRITIRTPVRRFGFDRRLARFALRRSILRSHHADPFHLVHIHVRTDVTEEVIPTAEELGLPVVLTEHNSYYHLGIRALPPKEQVAERNRIRAWLGRPIIRRVMPVSNDLANVLHEDYGVERERMHIVPNIAAAVFSFGSPPLPPPFRLVLAAQWRPPKDHDVFIMALSLLPKTYKDLCHIDWIGGGPDLSRIQERCRTELPAMNIRFPGLLPKAALAEFMQKAHLFVLPTKSDNLPCVVLESLCCGTPVISMAVNGVPELINGTNGILVPPSDPVALSKALMECVDQPDRWDRGNIALEARARYGAKAVAVGIGAVYDLASGSNGRTWKGVLR